MFLARKRSDLEAMGNVSSEKDAADWLRFSLRFELRKV